MRGISFSRVLYRTFPRECPLSCSRDISFLQETQQAWFHLHRRISFLLNILCCRWDIYLSLPSIQIHWHGGFEIKGRHNTITQMREIQYVFFIVPYPRSFKISFIFCICSNNSFSRFCSIATTWAGALATKSLFSSFRLTTAK